MTARLARSDWSTVQRLKNDLLWGMAYAGVHCLHLLPRRSLSPIGRLLGSFAHGLLGGPRRLAVANLSLVYPELTPATRKQMTRALFRTLGANLMDTLALLRPDEIAGSTLGLPESTSSTLCRLLERGRGLIYVTAHLGPWERMAALLSSHGFPITTVARESYDCRFHGLLYDPIRKRRGVQAIYRASPSAPFTIVRSLRAGRILGFPIDLPGRVPVHPVRLLGQPSSLPVGPARIALRTGSPIVLGTPGPAGAADRVSALVVRVEELPTSDLEPGPPGEATLLQRIADALTERIQALPLHWPWMHPSFTTAQEGVNCGRMSKVDRLRGEAPLD